MRIEGKKVAKKVTEDRIIAALEPGWHFVRINWKKAARYTCATASVAPKLFHSKVWHNERMAARKKDKGGRPPKYATEDKLAAMIDAYWAVCESLKRLPNKAGLCLHLGISRDTYSEYRRKFPDAIKNADLEIEHAWIGRLESNSPTGAIFYLKNAFKEEYKDRHENDNTHTFPGLSKDDVGALISKLPQEQQDALYATITDALTRGQVPGGKA